MATISENLQIIKDSTDAIRRVILEKGGTISGGISTYTDSITNIINNASNNNNNNSNTSTYKKDVNFYDYDGTLLHSYTKDEFLSLSQLPELPTREGLTCQEWNYNLEDAKEYVNEYGVLDIGATYITDDGKTRLYVKIAALGRMSVPLCFSQTVSKGVIIDWGDGSATQTLSGTGVRNTTHTYTNIGNYVITLEVTSGTLGLGASSSSYSVMGSTGNSGVYCNMLQKVEIGSNVTSIGNNTFDNCYSLAYIVMPNSVTSIGTYAFDYCYSLASIVIPNSVTSIGTYAFDYCYSLASIVIPNSVTSIGNNAFYYCCSLASIVIPNSMTSIGNNAFYSCYSLASIVIPNSMTSIGNGAFNSCYSLASIVIPNSMTSIGNNAFYSCKSLAYIVIPNSVTSIGTYAFYSCYSLASIVIPNSVTSIGNNAFCNCNSLASIVIPNSVTSIGNNAFYYCYGMAYYDFRSATEVPTLSATNAFQDIPYDCKIVVPDALYDSWIAATNWSTYATKIVKASAFNG